MTTTMAGPDRLASVVPFPGTPSSVGSSSRARGRGTPVGGTGAAGGTGLRLTRRGRAVVVAIAVMIALAAGSVAQQASARTPGRAVPVTAHTVTSGETLWQIADGLAEPGQDVREVVDQLIALNELPGSGLHVGQQILVPAT